VLATPSDRVEAVVTIAERPPLRDSDLENLTGLVRAVSGERTPKSPQPASSAPLHLGVDQGDKRFDVACSKRLVRGTHHIDAHAAGGYSEAAPDANGDFLGPAFNDVLHGFLCAARG
jgi:hypothetical protein